jgi:hypothetical protein
MLGQNRPKTENSTGLVNSGTAFANLTIKHTTFVGVPLVLQTVIILFPNREKKIHSQVSQVRGWRMTAIMTQPPSAAS